MDYRFTKSIERLSLNEIEEGAEYWRQEANRTNHPAAIRTAEKWHTILRKEERS